MKNSLKNQIMKLKGDKPNDKSNSKKKDKKSQMIHKSRVRSQKHNMFFKNISFCFPLSDIQLTQKQIDKIQAQITEFGGKVVQFGDHLYFQPIQYVLVSSKVRVSTVQKKIQNKLNYVSILDYNYVQCCISEGDLVDIEGFKLQNNSNANQQKSVPIKWQGTFGKSKKKIKLQEKQQSEHIASRSMTDEIPLDDIEDMPEKVQRKKSLDKDKFFCQTGKDQDKSAMNKFIEKQLLELQKIYANERDVGRRIAYGKAASTVRTWKGQITTEQDADKIPGIGPKILKKIKELIRTGKMKKLDELNQSQENVSLKELTRVWGVGPAKAKQLYKSGIKSIEQLQKNQESLTKNQKVGLKHFKDFQTRIPRDKVTKLFQFVKATLKQITKDSDLYSAQVCGSYRRGKASCGDMDVIITRRDGTFQKDLLVRLIAKLTENKFLTDNLSQPKCTDGHVSTSYMGVCQLQDQTHHRIDIKHYPYLQYAFAMLYFTGSGMFNRSMRLYANKLGLHLSDKGFEIRPAKKQKDGVWKKPIPPCFKQEDIFKVLGLDYKSPKERDD